MKLYHGGAAPVPTPRAGTFLTDAEDTARTYALYGPNQQRRVPAPGVVSVYACSATNIKRFNSFAEAYTHFGVRSTQALAKSAAKKSPAELVVVYDEYMLVRPDVVRFLGSYAVAPERENPTSVEQAERRVAQTAAATDRARRVLKRAQRTGDPAAVHAALLAWEAASAASTEAHAALFVALRAAREALE